MNPVFVAIDTTDTERARQFIQGIGDHYRRLLDMRRNPAVRLAYGLEVRSRR